MGYCKSGNFRENFIFALKDIFVTLKIATRVCFTYISQRQSDFGILRRFYSHETSKFRENKTLAKILVFTV